MNNLNNIPFSYLCISTLLSGFAVYSLFEFIYIYFKTRRKAIIHLILFGSSAALFIASDAAAVVYYILTSEYESARIFINFRELSPLLFIIALPYLMGQILVLKAGLLKLNNFLFWSGLIASVVISAAALYNPELLIGTPVPEMKGNYYQVVIINDIRFLLILKYMLLIFYIIYGLSTYLYSKINNKTAFPVSKIIVSFIILIYCVSSSFFSVIFFKNTTPFISFYFPYISFGIAVFLLSNSFGVVDILIDYSYKLIKMENNLIRIIYEDSDTGVANRNGFINDMQMKLLNGKSGSLIFIDIDDFQNINESFGEKTGDELLKSFSSRLNEIFKSEGKLYRIGGDDFVLILHKSRTDAESGNLADKIISSLRNPFPISGVSHTLTVSVGIVQIPRDGNEVDSILNNGYSVIRAAKQTKNTYRIFSRKMADYTTSKISMVNLLRTCINMDQFMLYYQPVVDAEGNLVYAESLLRCTNPDKSIGGPGDFIPLLEKAGLMKDVDNMVMRIALHDMEMHVKKRFGISINLSSSQIIDPTYGDFLSAFTIQHGIEPSRITLEVVENTLIENLRSGRETILRLKEKGFKIAIDDFGKGYSSLSYLSELPVDILKIDMAFVESIPGDLKKEAIASNIIELAHSLDLKVVAEGFEKTEQFEFFKNLGCDNFQGYFFSHPVPLDQLIKKYFG